MTGRKLGKTDLVVSPLVLGAWQYGNTPFWSEVSTTDVATVMARAVDGGITTIDTAIGYGGSEKVIGSAIKGIRQKLTIISKGGADPRRMERNVDISLSRLGLDVIDLYLVHYPDAAVPIEETMGGMMRLKEKGKIRHVGVSNFSREQLLKAVAVAEVCCLQQAFNLLWREIDVTGTLAACREHGVAILAYSPLGQGLFTGRIRSEADLPTRKGDVRTMTLLFKGEAFQAGLAMVERLDGLAAKYGKTVAQVALNWVVGQEGITAAIVGSRTVAQLDDNLGALGWEMDRADREMLSREGLAASKLFDYSCSIFGLKYDGMKIDDMIDSSL